jgi:hypothetical protein
MELLLLVLGIGVPGWSLQGHQKAETRLVPQFFRIFLLGFSLLSVLLFFLAVLGVFRPAVIIAVWALFPLIALRRRRLRFFDRRLLYFSIFCISIAFAALAMSKLVKPFEAYLKGDDASIYLGASAKLARSGSLFYTDPLVAEMTENEKGSLLYNRIFEDTTGPYARFFGGVRVVNIAQNKVTFAFYHLFPIWMAFGYLFLGLNQFLQLLSLFAVLSGISLFLVGRALGGWITGICGVAIIVLFYPQAFFSRMPSSELLTQMLFLTGLWVLMDRVKTDGTLSRQDQILSGLLWGAMFLARVDALFFTFLIVLIVFTLVKPFALRISTWRPFLYCLVFFAFLALHHQLMTGEYLYLQARPFLGDRALGQIANTFVVTVAVSLQSHPVPGLLVWGALLCAMLFFLRKLKDLDVISVRRSAIALSVAAIILVPWLAAHFQLSQILQHALWVSLYIPPFLLMVFLTGVAFLIFAGKKNGVARLSALFLMLPFVCYLVFPMVGAVSYQPWSIRRFVPVVFPLLFVLGIAGWRQAISRLSSATISSLAVTGFACWTALVFFGQSESLFTQPVFTNVLEQTGKLAASIPPKGLLVMPDEQADTHLEIPLQFIFDRDSLSLPLVKNPFGDRNQFEASFRDVVTGYLKRQLQQGRPVLLLTTEPDANYRMFRDFNLKPQAAGLIEFLSDKRAPRLSLPEVSRTEMRYYIFSLNEGLAPVPRADIRYNDDQVKFLDFHRPGQHFRWTSGHSEIANFVYETKGRPTVAALTLYPMKMSKNANLDLKMLVNDTVPARFLRKQNETYLFLISGAPEKITSAAIESGIFSPAERGNAMDRRHLGVPFRRLQFLDEDAVSLGKKKTDQ